jgi:hypothetical protein
MRTTKATRKALLAVLLSLLAFDLGCSPRDFLSRRLAADLISASDTFKAPQLFWIRTGIVSNLDFISPDSMVLQRRGWISGIEQKCPGGVEPPPCWDVALTPLGVGMVRLLISSPVPNSGPTLQVARRELLSIDGISKAGNLADVEFTWRWIPMNEVGAALHDSGVHYRSRVGFRSYDNGWRVVDESFRNNQTLDEALRNAEPTAP